MYYYQCKYCGNTPIKSSSSPNTSGCTMKPFHHWVKVGEVGDIVYSCKHCGTQVSTKSTPNTSGCTMKPFHHWVKLADNTPRP